MGEVKSIGIVRVSPGFTSEEIQRSRLQTKFPKDLELIPITEGFGLSMDELEDIVRRTHAQRIAIANLDVLGPFVKDAEDLLGLFALLENLETELHILEPTMVISPQSPLPYRMAKTLWDELRVRRKKEIANASREKALAKGHSLGRKAKGDPQQIRLLRSQGHSIRSIANITGIAPASVQRAINKPDQ